jgi:hypothetical protein
VVQGAVGGASITAPQPDAYQIILTASLRNAHEALGEDLTRASSYLARAMRQR